jgi:hypothetical protein
MSNAIYILVTAIVSLSALVGLSQLFAELQRHRQPGVRLRTWRWPSLEEFQAYGLALVILTGLSLAIYYLGGLLILTIGQIGSLIGPVGCLAIGSTLGLLVLKSLVSLFGQRSIGI